MTYKVTILMFSTDSCEWEEWADWGTCSESCGGGEQNRTRTKSNGGDDCTENMETRACNTEDCKRRKRSTETSIDNNSTSSNGTGTNSTSETPEKEIKRDCKWEKKCICEDIPDTTLQPAIDETTASSTGNGSSASSNNSTSSNNNSTSNNNTSSTDNASGGTQDSTNHNTNDPPGTRNLISLSSFELLYRRII